MLSTIYCIPLKVCFSSYQEEKFMSGTMELMYRSRFQSSRILWRVLLVKVFLLRVSGGKTGKVPFTGYVLIFFLFCSHLIWKKGVHLTNKNIWHTGLQKKTKKHIKEHSGRHHLFFSGCYLKSMSYLRKKVQKYNSHCIWSYYFNK